MSEKLTVEELVKALRLCTKKTENGETCITGQKDCPFGVAVLDCIERMNLAAGSLLESLAAERDGLKEQLAAALAENTKLAEQVPHWISVKDRLPKPEEEVIVSCVALCGYKQITTALYEDGTVNADESDWNWTDVDFDYDKKSGIYYIPKGWWEYKHYNPDDVYNNQIDDAVTHWMPLPEPPKEESNE